MIVILGLRFLQIDWLSIQGQGGEKNLDVDGPAVGGRRICIIPIQNA